MAPASPLAAIRWLPLANRTAATIPALACVRLVGATLDATGQVIFAVDQPNGDSSATYLFNGPCSIAPGANGSGTLGFPAQASWDAGTPAVGDVWGPKSGQWSLSPGQLPGFAVLGVVDSLTQRMMVGRGSPASATVVKPLYDIAPIAGSNPGSGSGEVYTFDGTNLVDSTTSIAVFNLNSQIARAGVFYECILIDGYAFIVGGAAATLFEAPLSASLAATDAVGALTAPATAIWGPAPDLTYPLAAQNDFHLSGAAGQKFLVAQADGGTCYLLQTLPAAASGGITFALTAAFSSGSAAATVGTPWGSAPDATGTAVTVNDLNGVYGRSLAGAKGEAIYDPTQGYVVVACDQETLRYRGVLGGTLAHTDASSTIGTLTAMNSFPFGQATADSTLTAQNVMSLGGSGGTACYLDWNQTEGQWELSMVAPAPQQVMCREKLTSGTNLLQYTTRTMLGWFDDTGESVYGTVPGWATSSVTAVVGTQFSSGLLQYQTQTFSAVGTAGAASGWDTIFSTVNVVAAVELQYDGGYGSAHAFQWQTAAFTAINSDYAGEGDVTESGWSNWATTTVLNDVTAVNLSGAGALTMTTTPNYVMEAGTANLPSAAGSLTTTTATIVAAVAYAGGALSYQTQTLTILAAGAVGAATNLFTTGSVTAVTALGSTSSPPTLTDQTTSFTAINPGSASASSAWYTPSYQNVVTNVSWDGTNLTETVTQEYVFGAGTSSNSTIDTPGVCGS